MLCIGLKLNGHQNENFIIVFFLVYCSFAILQLIFTLCFNVNQDQNWPFKKKIEFCYFSSLRIVLFKFRGLKPMPLYAVNLRDNENLIEIIMISKS